MKISSQISLCLTFVISLLILFGISTFFIARQTENAATGTVLTNHLAQDAATLSLEAAQVQQWLTDISTIRASNTLNNDFLKTEKYKTSFLNHLSEVKNRCKSSGQDSLLPELEVLETNFLAYYAAGISIAASYGSDMPESGNKKWFLLIRQQRRFAATSMRL